jgi:hypothetical protein
MCGLTWFAMDDFPRGYSFKGACLQIHVSNRFLVGALEHDFYDFPYIGNNNPN